MSYLMKPMSFVLVILLGHMLKRFGFFEKNEYKLLSKIMMNITLPCAVIHAFDGFERQGRMFWLVGIGLLFAFLPALLVYLGTRGMDARTRAFRMLNVSGYNVGCFSMPLIQAFFGSRGMVAACMFDTGNAVMMTGGLYAMTSTLLHTGGKEQESVGQIILKFLKSVPFDTYMVMILIAAAGIKIPQAVFELTRPAAQANAFIAMLMIGMMFEPTGDKQLLVETARLIVFRLMFASVTACVVYFLTPFDLLVRQVIAVICFAPLSGLSPVYTDRCHGDTAMSSFMNSVSIAVSLIVMVALSLYFVT